MNLRKPNHNEATKTDNSIGDFVVVEGVVSPEEIYDRGVMASRNTIELLKQMYPKSPEYELREREAMANEFLSKELAKLEQDNKEKVSSIYASHIVKTKIKSLKDEISELNEKYAKEKRVNYIYEKEMKIKELEAIIEEFKRTQK